MRPVQIYTNEDSSRFKYLLDFIFNSVLNCGYQLVKNQRDVVSGPCFNYGLQFPDAVVIPYASAFQEIKNIKVDFGEQLINADNRFSFDFFLAIFYLLARVEEYEPIEKDEHGRYLSTNSSLANKDLLRVPLIDLWIAELRDFIAKKWKVNIPYKRIYSFSSTIDIDHFYAYKNKPLAIQLGGFIRDSLLFKFGRLVDRFSSDDPYDRLNDMIAWHQDLGLQFQFFVLTAQRTDRDKSLDPQSSQFRRKVAELAKSNAVGIHPSYYAEDNNSLITEKTLLESIVAKPVTRSRQHYLRMSMPHTCRALIDSGIKEDNTMGYPDVLGFRSGTSYPFYWYDLEQDEVSNLKIIPFQVMDVTMKQYLGLSPEEGLEKSKEIIDIIKSVNGNFGLIWHNSSFYSREGWSGWEGVYKSILEYAKP